MTVAPLPGKGACTLKGFKKGFMFGICLVGTTGLPRFGREVCDCQIKGRVVEESTESSTSCLIGEFCTFRNSITTLGTLFFESEEMIMGMMIGLTASEGDAKSSLDIAELYGEAYLAECAKVNPSRK